MNTTRLTVVASERGYKMLYALSDSFDEGCDYEVDERQSRFEFRHWPTGLKGLVFDLVEEGEAIAYLSDDVGNAPVAYYRDMKFVLPSVHDEDQDTVTMSMGAWKHLSEMIESKVTGEPTAEESARADAFENELIASLAKDGNLMDRLREGVTE